MRAPLAAHFLTAAALVAALVSPMHADPDVGGGRLAFGPDRSEPFRYRLTVGTDVTQGSQAVSSTRVLEMTWWVASFDDYGGREIAVEVERVAFKGTGEEWQSTSGIEAPPDAAPFAALIGTPLKFAIDSRGDVTGFEGTAATVVRLADDLPDGPDREVLARRVELAISEQSFEALFDRVLHIYPNELVRPGAVWTVESAHTAPLPCSATSRVTCEGIERGEYKLAVSQTLRTTEGAPAIDMGLGPVTFSLSGEGQGTYVVRESDGIPVNNVLTQTMVGTALPEGNAAEAAIPLRIVQRTTLEWLREAPAKPAE